jgi:hypothetical protein
LLASRGIWSLVIFLGANWVEISTFFNSRNKQLPASAVGAAAVATTAGKTLPPPQAEQEQPQLNVALQTEIVRFTVLGIQRAVRDLEETMNDSERHSGGASMFFVSHVLCFFLFVVAAGVCVDFSFSVHLADCFQWFLTCLC